MPSVSDLKQSKYLKKEDVGDGKVVTIRKYVQVDVGQDNKPDIKWALKFDELDKPLVLNSTNGELIAEIVREQYGVKNNAGDFDNWLGKQVELYDDKNVFFAGKRTGGIRVRPAKGHHDDTNVDATQTDDIPF